MNAAAQGMDPPLAHNETPACKTFHSASSNAIDSHLRWNCKPSQVPRHIRIRTDSQHRSRPVAMSKPCLETAVNTNTELPEDEEHVLPCTEAMLAGTLALMTGHAQSACATQRNLMGRKIRSNLFFLGQHPALTPNFRTVLQRMHQHWDTLLKGSDSSAAQSSLRNDDLLPERRLWHTTASTVQ